MSELFIGLMSGTSLDGIDGVLADFSDIANPDCPPLTVRAHAHRAFDEGLRDELLSLNTSGPDELRRAALAGNGLARCYADVVAALLAEGRVSPGDVAAIGAHGQTVRHRPGEFDGIGFSLQLGNPALLAELTGIDVIADFRSRDVAAGGQGAPLVPAFHRTLFGSAGETTAVLNIGGVSNLTSLAADGRTLGFDCGPGNSLMDSWCLQHTGQPFDMGGAWAAGGLVLPELLNQLGAEPYFALPPPKSTGRDLFNPAWLALKVARHAPSARPADVQASLCELTATTCAAAVQAHAGSTRELLVCGGGALNAHLMHRLAHHLPGITVATTDSRGLPALQVEAAAFAWLARAFVRREPGNLNTVTGAAGPRVLGALYPA